ncbi:MAG: SoxR reducing system RseC family protein [Azovibrio sp.]
MEKQGDTEQTGRVVSLDGGFVLVQVVGGGCGRCHEKGGCGGQQLTQMFCASPRQYRLENSVGARPHDQVSIVLPAGVLRHYATLAYGFPLLCLIAGALLGDFLGGDPGALSGAGAGLFSSWLILRSRSRSVSGSLKNRPYISRIKSVGG